MNIFIVTWSLKTKRLVSWIRKQNPINRIRCVKANCFSELRWWQIWNLGILSLIVDWKFWLTRIECSKYITLNFWSILSKRMLTFEWQIPKKLFTLPSTTCRSIAIPNDNRTSIFSIWTLTIIAKIFYKKIWIIYLSAFYWLSRGGERKYETWRSSTLLSDPFIPPVGQVCDLLEALLLSPFNKHVELRSNTAAIFCATPFFTLSKQN